MDPHLTDEQAGLLLALALIVAAPIATNAQTTAPRQPTYDQGVLADCLHRPGKPPLTLELYESCMKLAKEVAQREKEQSAPYTCRLLYDEQKKCAFGSCDVRVIERLKNDCLRDGGRP